jgi:MFS superfamily sulfate permease-like transporter
MSSPIVPLLGLSALAKQLHLSHSLPLDKLFFIIENISRTHRLTALISLVSLLILLASKIVKPKLIKRYRWISYIPEILIVVVVATCKSVCEHAG